MMLLLNSTLEALDTTGRWAAATELSNFGNIGAALGSLVVAIAAGAFAFYLLSKLKQDLDDSEDTSEG